MRLRLARPTRLPRARATRPSARAPRRAARDPGAGRDSRFTVARAASRATASQLPVAHEVGDPQVGQPAVLARAEELARAADAQVGIGDREAVRAWRASPRAAPRCPRPLPRATSTQVPGLRAAPDAPAQLVQLREAEALGVLDDHQRRVRDVDAHLDHRRRHEHLRLAGLEARHRGLTRRRRRAGRAGDRRARPGSAAAIRCADSLAARRSLFSDSSISG